MVDKSKSADEKKKTYKVDSSSGKRDQFNIGSSNNPEISLALKILNGSNYRAWSRSMRIAFGAKRNLDLSMVKFRNLVRMMKAMKTRRMLIIWSRLGSLIPSIKKCQILL